jgi:hypothetical protein
MYDIAFISFNEAEANTRYFELATTITTTNRLFRVHGVKGIHQAHIEAAKQAKTNMFYVVDADAKILPTFKFNLILTPEEEDIVHVWRSRNPMNELEYGYGGVKLLPRQLTTHMDTSNTDMTTSISKRFKAMPEVSNITAFNTDALSTWRSAFRECAKLASGIIPGQVSQETQERLNIWRYNSNHRPFAEYARGGASAGEWYGRTYQDDPELLSKINDYDWLEGQYYYHIETYPPSTFK